MFMVCVDFRGKNNKFITRSCRSAMLHYRSFILDVIYTVAYCPFLLVGTVEEKQTVVIELFEDYEEVEVCMILNKLYNHLFMIIFFRMKLSQMCILRCNLLISKYTLQNSC